jgi:TRAP-type C4-dicarboxylate transport system permease small subunit
MSDLLEEASPAPAGAGAPQIGGPLSRVFFVIGGAGLLASMATDSVSVAGRRLGVPFLGAIELFQACVVAAASSALIVATLAEAHASVHILTERLPERGRAWLMAFGALAGAACFLVLGAGSAWVIRDLWGGHERTELLGLPVLPERLFWCASAAIVAGLLVRRAVVKMREGLRP